MITGITLIRAFVIAEKIWVFLKKMIDVWKNAQ